MNLQQFFNDLGASQKEEDLSSHIDKAAYIAASEWGWSQKDFEECEIPYLLTLLRLRKEFADKQKKDSKKRKY